MKGLILAAGKGTRMTELKLLHKSFAEVKSKKLIEYSLNLLTESGADIIDEIIIVVGYHGKDIIENVGDSYNGIRINYVFQQEQKGIAHAVKMAANALNDDFVLCLADEILISPRLEEMIDFFKSTCADIMCGAVINADDLSMKPIAYSVDENRNVYGVKEKPSVYENAYRGVGECVFRKNTLQYLKSLQPNPCRGEYEMGDWIRMAIEDGNKVKIFDLADAYVNINYADDLKEASEIL